MDNIIPFGAPKPPPQNDSIAGVLIDDPICRAVDNFRELLEANRDKVDNFICLVTFKETPDGGSGFQLVLSPMTLATFSLGVRILDNAANQFLSSKTNLG